MKNLKCYALGIMILATSSGILFSNVIVDKYNRYVSTKNSNKKFNEFLEENNISSIYDLNDVPYNYYESLINDDKENPEYKRLDSIRNIICMGREHDYDYKVLKIDEVDEEYVVTSVIADNLDDYPDYDYVYKDDYVIDNGYRDVYIKYGNVLERK